MVVEGKVVILDADRKASQQEGSNTNMPNTSNFVGGIGPNECFSSFVLVNEPIVVYGLLCLEGEEKKTKTAAGECRQQAMTQARKVSEFCRRFVLSQRDFLTFFYCVD